MKSVHVAVATWVGAALSVLVGCGSSTEDDAEQANQHVETDTPSKSPAPAAASDDFQAFKTSLAKVEQGSEKAVAAALASTLKGQKGTFVGQKMLLSEGILIFNAQIARVDWSQLDAAKFAIDPETTQPQEVGASIGESNGTYSVIKMTLNGSLVVETPAQGSESTSHKQFKTSLQKILQGSEQAVAKALGPSLGGQKGVYVGQGLLVTENILIFDAQLASIDWSKVDAKKFAIDPDTTEPQVVGASIESSKGAYTVTKLTLNGSSP